MMELWGLILISPLALPTSRWATSMSLCLFGSVLMWSSSESVSKGLGSDGLTVVLLSLTAGVVLLMTVYQGANTGDSWLLLLFILLLWALSFCFVTLSSLYFYLLFEFSLIPMALLVLGWGPQPERLLASVYMLFYTITASIPLLFLILLMSSPWFFAMEGVATSGFTQSVVAAAMSLAFLVKLPMFLTHLWLPKAHVEAPCTGSMFLAGVLLKLGGFGLYRFASLMSSAYSLVVSSLGLMGACLAAFITLVQNDLKALIAYSSVVHMGLILASLLLKSPMGLLGAVWMMVGHGFCSSSLFCLGTGVYERLATRNLLICQGLLSLTPGLALFWALSILANCSAPPSLNLFSEALMIWSCASLRVWLLAPISLVVILSLAYGLFLYAKTFAGLSADTQTSFDENIKEHALGLAHLGWLVLAPVYVFIWMSQAKGSYVKHCPSDNTSYLFFYPLLCWSM